MISMVKKKPFGSTFISVSGFVGNVIAPLHGEIQYVHNNYLKNSIQKHIQFKFICLALFMIQIIAKQLYKKN